MAGSNGVLRTEHIGRLVADPELVETAGGPVVRFRVVTNFFGRDRETQNEWEYAEAVNWQLWHQTAGFMKRMKKGGRVRIVGHQRTRVKEENGQKTYYVNMILDEWLDLNGAAAVGAGQPEDGGQGGEPPEDLDRIPF